MPNLRVVRHIRTPEGALIRPEIWGSWIVEPGNTAKITYAKGQLGICRAEEPNAGWTLETRGTESNWHPFEGAN